MPDIQPPVGINVNPKLLAPLLDPFKLQPMVTDLGNVILEALDRLGQTQSWLAEQVGVSNQAVTKWIRTGQIGRENIQDVANALQITTDALLGGVSSAGSTIGRIVESLPDEPKQEVLDFLLYKIDRADTPLLTEKRNDYIRMIKGIVEDMEKRKLAPAQPPKLRPRGRRSSKK